MMEIKTDGTGKGRKTQLKAYKRMMGVREKRSAGKRTVEIKITVRIPSMMTKRDAIREVRSLVNDQCNYAADPGDVRIVRAK